MNKILKPQFEVGQLVVRHSDYDGTSSIRTIQKVNKNDVSISNSCRKYCILTGISEGYGDASIRHAFADDIERVNAEEEKRRLHQKLEKKLEILDLIKDDADTRTLKKIIAVINSMILGYELTQPGDK